ncbi:gluconokinase [Loktanella sp. DSM 29012]|nr:gluconokinase [Loktanella sp. DSM 29012]
MTGRANDLHRIVIMGVSGCGKSTVGQALAHTLGALYLEGDDLHPPGNIAAMSAGQPLTDEMRAPWLDRIRDAMDQLVNEGHMVIAGCSALRRIYRERLAQTGPVFYVHLALSPAVAHERIANRLRHFMPASLSVSQARALEPLYNDEQGITLDAGSDLPEIVEQVLLALKSSPDPEPKRFPIDSGPFSNRG